MLSIVAVRPARARSSTSPPARGRSRTRSPALSSIPSATTESSGMRSSSRCHSHSFIFASVDTQTPQRAVHFHQLLGGQRFAAFENQPRPFVALAHLALLVVGQRENAERQDFVNLSSVEEFAGAFRRYLRIIVEDNRR